MKYEEPLSVTHPELCEEWSERNFPFTPDDETAGSHDKVWWKGKCGHEWQATVNNRASGSGCPYCTGRKVLVGFNDLATVRPELVDQWSQKNAPLTPQQFAPYSRKRIIWRCKEGHEWETSIANRSRGNGCPICSNKKLVKGINDLATLRPELAAEWSDRNLPLTPDQIREKHYAQVWWKCPDCGNEYKCHILSRIERNSTCPYCAGRMVKVGFNDLSTTHPTLAASWDYERNGKWRPEDFTAKSRKFIWWHCECGHSYGVSIRTRAENDPGCSVCRAELMTVLPALLTILYAKRAGYEVKVGYQTEYGAQIEAYVPTLRLAIEQESFSETGKAMQEVKRRKCTEEGIHYAVIPRLKELTQMAELVQKSFAEVGTNVDSAPDEDVKLIQAQFTKLRKEIYQETINESEETT